MGMIQNPGKYTYLDRFLLNTDNMVTLDLPPTDKARYLDLQKEIADNDDIKEGFRQMRQANVKKARNQEGIYGQCAKLFTDENAIRAKLANRMNDEGLARLQIKNNPMEKRKFSVKWP